MNSEVQTALGFNLHAPLKTIHAYLSGLNPSMLHLLDDELIEVLLKQQQQMKITQEQIQKDLDIKNKISTELEQTNKLDQMKQSNMIKQ